MTTTDTQQVPYFGTPNNVASLAKMRLLRLHVGSSKAYMVHSWYMQMRDLAKQGKTFGQFTTNVITFVESIGAPVPEGDALSAFVEDCAAVWDAFEAVDLIAVDGDVRDVRDLFRVTVHDFHETNVSRGSRVTTSRDTPVTTASERKAKSRENKRRRDMGLPTMSDSEAVEWLLSRRVTSQSVTASPVTPIQTNKEDIQTTTPQAPRTVVTEATRIGQIKTEHQPAVIVPTIDRGRPAASEIKQRIETKLTAIFDDPNDAVTLAHQILVKSRSSILTAKGSSRRQVFPLDAWERTVNVIVRQIVEDKREVTGDLMGLIVTMVPQYELEGSDKPLKVRSIQPELKRDMTPEEIRAEFERAAEAAERGASV